MSFPVVEIRPRRSMVLFAVLAVATVIASYVFVVLLAAACVYIPFLILFRADSFAPQSLLLFLFGIVIAATMLWSLIPRRDKFSAPGMRLDRSTQPKLFDELDGIAAALNETPPREVYLIGAANAFVADRGGIMGFGSRRIMGLGLPLLSLLTISQFRAVLAHEFAHYYGGDTSLGPWVYKTKSSIVRIFENIGSLGELARMAVLGLMYVAVTGILKAYFVAFLRTVNLVSRRQEYRADELACLVAGRKNLIDGLQTIHRADAAWPVFWNGEVAPPLSDGSLLAIGDGFARFVSVPAISAALTKNLEARLQEENTNAHDTHPPLRDRIAAAQNLADGSLPQDERSAITLLENLPSTEVKFVEECVPDMRPGTLKYVSWDDVPIRVTIPAWQKFVTEYAEALSGVTAETLPDQVPRFREIGSSIRDPKGMLLSPPQRTARAGSLFASALALALIRGGWELHVQPAIFHIRRGDREFNPFEAVEQLMMGKVSGEEWISRCRDLGIAQFVLAPSDGVSENLSSESESESESRAGLPA